MSKCMSSVGGVLEEQQSPTLHNVGKPRIFGYKSGHTCVVSMNLIWEDFFGKSIFGHFTSYEMSNFQKLRYFAPN